MKYSCPQILNTLHFKFDYVSGCCTNADGPVFYPAYKGEKLDWEKITSERKKIYDSLDAGVIPECCVNCCELKEEPFSEPFQKGFKRFYISHWLHCNSACSYCVHKNIKTEKEADIIKPSSAYNLLPVLKEMQSENLILDNVWLYVTGGEPTLLKELDDIIALFSAHGIHLVTFFTSGIRYSPVIQKCLNTVEYTDVIISIDSGTGETFKKIKSTDSFEAVKSNILKYTEGSLELKKKIVLKYILLLGINDNYYEIDEWLKLAVKLGLVNIRLDVDYGEETFAKGTNIPKHYYELFDTVQNKARQLGLNLQITTMITDFLKKGKVV